MPAPVWLIGSYDGDGKPNAMTASWAGICCSRPPCVNVSLRKATFSFGCIRDRRAFTVSIPSREHVAEADYFGTVSGRDKDKFAVTGLTPVASEVVDAPYVEECPLVLECKLLRTIELGLHTLFVGEIIDVKADETVLSAEGLPVPGKVRPILYGPEIRVYHELGGVLGKGFSLGSRYEDDNSK